MMLPEIKKYLYDVKSHLHMDPATEKRIISELYTYFQEKVTELQEKNLPEKEAVAEAIRSFGRARVVARMMYEAYGRGSWTEAIMSATPHLLAAGLFFYHLWRHPVVAPLVFVLIVAVTLLGWWHGKPNWLYSWIGYSWLPLLIVSYASRPALIQSIDDIIRGGAVFSIIWRLVLILSLFILSAAIIFRTTLRVVKRDWILASLMLVPLPILGSWLVQIEQVGGLLQGSGVAVYRWDMVMALVFAVLSIASATFIRVRQRIIKFGALVTLGVIAGAVAGYNLWGGLAFLGLLGASLISLLFLFIPAFLEAKTGHGEYEGEAWWAGDWVEHPSG